MLKISNQVSDRDVVDAPRQHCSIINKTLATECKVGYLDTTLSSIVTIKLLVTE